MLVLKISYLHSVAFYRQQYKISLLKMCANSRKNIKLSFKKIYQKIKTGAFEKRGTGSFAVVFRIFTDNLIKIQVLSPEHFSHVVHSDFLIIRQLGVHVCNEPERLFS